MKKVYVLDTSALLHTPNVLDAFEDNDLVIPGAVLGELDSLKLRPGDVGATARWMARQLLELRTGGSLKAGVPLKGGGTLRVVGDDDGSSGDGQILATCRKLSGEGTGLGSTRGVPVILVTNDTLLAVRADAMGVKAETLRSAEMEPYAGRQDVYAEPDHFERLAAGHEVDVEGLMIWEDETYQAASVNPLEYIVLHETTSQSTLLGRISPDGRYLRRLAFENVRPYDVTPRNASQRFMIDALMSPVSEVPLVVFQGPAGTAKTFLALAAGLQLTANEGVFRRLLVSRPNVLLGDDQHGALPGSEREKIMPLMRPILDNLDALVGDDEYVNELIDRRIIDLQAMGYLRGRSVDQQWMILDEAQNTSPATVHSVISRAGDGTKIVLCGDPNQVDSPYLDARSNGLVFAARSMRTSSMTAVVTTLAADVVRSPLAKEVARLMG